MVRVCGSKIYLTYEGGYFSLLRKLIIYSGSYFSVTSAKQLDKSNDKQKGAEYFRPSSFRRRSVACIITRSSRSCYYLYFIRPNFAKLLDTFTRFCPLLISTTETTGAGISDIAS